MTQDGDLDGLVRKRIRGLRVALGWSLDDLAARCYLSPSTLSRIETGHRRISLDQLTSIARALGSTLDQLVESVADDDVVIRPEPRRGTDELKVHPGKDWFTVLSGTIVLLLGERTIMVEAGQAAEFSTMIPHAFGAHGGPAEILGIFDHDGQRTHLQQRP